MQFAEFPGNPAGWATINMNTMTDEELAAVAASGDPVASWPVAPIMPTRFLWPMSGWGGDRTLLTSHEADS